MERLASLPIDDFLGRLGSKEPVPGGGAAAGVTGAIGAALALMVVSYSIGRKSIPAAQAELEGLGSELRELEGVFLVSADLDAKAYAELSSLWKLPKENPERARKWAGAVAQAMAVPKSIMGSGLTLLDTCLKLAPLSNPNLLSDLAGAAAIAEACVRAAGQNVRVNAALLEDREAAERILIELERDRLRAGELRAKAEGACGS